MKTELEKTEGKPRGVFRFITTTPLPFQRIASLDQCRGFCILLMIGGNFAGKFSFMPWILTHHRYGMTMAELFGPLFFLLVGFGYRMSFLGRSRSLGTKAAIESAVRRYTVLLLIGLIVYFGHFWDALSHIGLAGLLLLPFIGASWRTRGIAALVFVSLYQVIFLYTGYGSWVMGFAYSLNGGPLAALSWGFIVLCGTFVYDAWTLRHNRRFTFLMLGAGLVLCLTGYALSLPWPEVKAAWPFTRYGMSAPYPVFTAGAAILIYLAFYWCCDVHHFHIPLATPMGANPLLMYAIMGAFVGMSKVVVQVWGEPGFYTALASYAAISLFCYGVASILYRRHIGLRIA